MIDLGDVVPLTVQIRDSTGVLADAGAVTLTVGLPDGTSVTPAVTHPSTGNYQVDYPTTQVGRHTVAWVATGVNASAWSDTFDVRAGDPGWIISLADAKAHLNITTTTDDEELRAFIEAATIVVAQVRDETIVRATVVEDHYVQHWMDRIALQQSPVISLTSIVSLDHQGVWDLTDLDLVQTSGVTYVLLGRAIGGHLRITYVAGYSAIPATYTLAAKIIVAHLWETQRAAAVAGARARFIGDTEDQVMVAGYAVPREAIELLGFPLLGFA